MLGSSLVGLVSRSLEYLCHHVILAFEWCLDSGPELLFHRAVYLCNFFKLHSLLVFLTFLFGLCFLHLHLQPSPFAELCLSALESLLVSVVLNDRKLLLGVCTVHVHFFKFLTSLHLLFSLALNDVAVVLVLELFIKFQFLAMQLLHFYLMLQFQFHLRALCRNSGSFVFLVLVVLADVFLNNFIPLIFTHTYALTNSLSLNLPLDLSADM